MNHSKTLISHIREFETALEEEHRSSGEQGWDHNYFEAFLRADLRFKRAAKLFGFEYPSEALDGDFSTQMREVSQRFRDHVLGWKSKLLTIEIENEVRLEYADLNQEFSESIAFDASGRKKIHELIGQLIGEVDVADWMGPDRKRRVLNAINAMQTEVDKELSNYHVVLGKIVDLGDALGKAGKKAKPAFDRLEQLGNAIKGRRKEALAIETDDAPLKIEDMRGEEDK